MQTIEMISKISAEEFWSASCYHSNLVIDLDNDFQDEVICDSRRRVVSSSRGKTGNKMIAEEYNSSANFWFGASAFVLTSLVVCTVAYKLKEHLSADVEKTIKQNFDFVSRRSMKETEGVDDFLRNVEEENFYRFENLQNYGDQKAFKPFGTIFKERPTSDFIPKIKDYSTSYNPGHGAHAEDEFSFSFAKENKTGINFFGLYDGHGGYTAGKFLKKNMHKFVLTHPTVHTDAPRALLEAIRMADQEYTDSLGPTAVLEKGKGGATCTVAVLDGNLMTFGWLGDSDVHLYKKNQVEAEICHEGHDVLRPDEYLRVQRDHPDAYGAVREGPARAVTLKPTRGVGDLRVKPATVPVPQLHQAEITKDHDFMILASDGVWDYMEPNLAGWIVRKHVKETGSTKGAADKLVHEATHFTRFGSHDDVTAMVVFFE